MQRLFSPDSRFMVLLARFADLMLLNILYLVTCIPIITIGSATAALYTVVFKIGTRREHGAVLPYFRAFRANFRQGCILWLALAFVSACLLFDAALFYRMSGGVRYLCVPFALLLVLALLTAGYLFPLVSLFENSAVGTIKNALALCLAHLPRSAAVLAVNAFPFALLAVSPLVFFYAGFIWLAVYFSAGAYINSLLLRKVFQPFLPEDTFKEEEE